MKKLILTSVAILSALATNVSAQAANLSMANQNFETKICYVAATQGLDAAKDLVASKGLSFRKFDKNVTCNDQSISKFADHFARKQLQGAESTQIQLVATNNDIESQICLESLTNGMDITAKKYKINKEHVRCNGKPLPRFVNEMKNRGNNFAVVPE